METSTASKPAAGVHASPAAAVTAAMLRKRRQRNQDKGDGSRKKGLSQGGFVHGDSLHR
jgi:hypothetical protein